MSKFRKNFTYLIYCFAFFWFFKTLFYFLVESNNINKRDAMAHESVRLGAWSANELYKRYPDPDSISHFAYAEGKVLVHKTKLAIPSNVDNRKLKLWQKEVWDELRIGVCNNQETSSGNEFFMDYGIGYRYIYTNINDQEIGSYYIDKKVCDDIWY